MEEHGGVDGSGCLTNGKTGKRTCFKYAARQMEKENRSHILVRARNPPCWLMLRAEILT